MAECVLKNMVAQSGRSSEFYIDSAATSREEIGNPIYPPAIRKLKEEGIPLSGHRAVQMIREDYDKYDLLLTFATCGASPGETLRGRSAACWITPAAPGTLPILGALETST